MRAPIPLRVDIHPVRRHAVLDDRHRRGADVEALEQVEVQAERVGQDGLDDVAVADGRPHRAGVYPGSAEHLAALDEAALRSALQQAAALAAAEAVIDGAWARLAPYYEQKEGEPWPPAP